ncbi:hypothetical protein EW026_g5352 [Hermanssonia centrifuga]|uniref:Metallo-beta-lactamase domain-containing protein n=1 Tax=Hermanssonia centrifuga TaxID=98765 RepID=A0A4S4KED5_9APHY|nr:hypothetical protein EW026_g5352 [Hermanssonia centrifuga]
MGLITLLRNVLGIPKAWQHHGHPPSTSTPQRTAFSKPKIEVYGPMGIRSFVRSVFNLTHTRSAENYCVHELLMPGEVPSALCEPAETMHQNEEAGKNIFMDEDGFWREITDHRMGSGGGHVIVDAGPIVHRDPCIGYVIREQPRQRELVGNDGAVTTKPIPRTIVILGDTSDPSALIPLIANQYDDPVSLLIHEATDAYIPSHIDKYGTTGRNRTEQSVKEKAIEKGHSTPAMAGLFAKQIGAERLVLNHIGSRFPAPPYPARSGGDKFRLACMDEIEKQATLAWDPPNGDKALASWDFCRVLIPANAPAYIAPAGDEDSSDTVDYGEDSIQVTATPSARADRSGVVSITHTHIEHRTGGDHRSYGRAHEPARSGYPSGSHQSYSPRLDHEGSSRQKRENSGGQGSRGHRGGGQGQDKRQRREDY